MPYASLDEWIEQAGIPFAPDSPSSLHAAVDRLMASLDPAVELLGFGETLHGGEEILQLRNQLFQYLVEAHGFRAIAIECSFPRARLVNEYIAGSGPASYEELRETGFSHGFGRLAANQELVEWMRDYNAYPTHAPKLRFYGCDMPLLAAGVAGPRQVLEFVLDYLAELDSERAEEYRRRMEPLIGSDAEWENPAAMSDPSQSIGRSPAADALRLATEELVVELRTRRPEFIARSGAERYWEALQYALNARELLNYHAFMAGEMDQGYYGRLLGIRDALMADNLVYITERERRRGRVLVFAHNSHLQRGQAVWPWYTFWPAGSHLHHMLGRRYSVIGTAVGVSEENGVGQPEPGTLEARMMTRSGPALFIPTFLGQGLPQSELASLPTRSASTKNVSYQVLTAQSLTNFDWLAFLPAVTYTRGGPPLG